MRLCCLLLLFLVKTLSAQARSALAAPTVPLGLRVSATEANSPPGSCGCFVLRGGGMDVNLPLRRSLTVDVEVAGQHAGRVPGTLRGLSAITLLAGPRYRIVLARRQSIFAQALFGAVRGFDADFRRGTNAVDTATAFAFAAGGAYELSLTKLLTLRPAQVDYVQTNLPNGSDNRQQNVRFGAGIVLNLSATGLRRR